MATTHNFILIPGFFGFVNIGELRYFAHVQRLLSEALEQRGITANVQAVYVPPTASLRARASRLAEALAALGGSGPVHLIGHSTGGLDARLLASPGASLQTEVDVEPLAASIRSVVSIASPHHGTPLASLFTGMMGQSLLRLLSLVTLEVVRLGRFPAPAVGRFIKTLGDMSASALDAGLVKQVYSEVLSDFSDERRAHLVSFFRDVSTDQGLLPQLTPDGMDLFNAKVTEREGVRYGSVVSWARPPSGGGRLAAGLSPAAHVSHTLYRFLHSATSRPTRVDFREWTSRQRRKLTDAGFDLGRSTANDAIVPTVSQAWGDVVYAGRADHLDLIGYFAGPKNEPPHVDWLRTISDFRRPQFEGLWRSVLAFCLDR